MDDEVEQEFPNTISTLIDQPLNESVKVLMRSQSNSKLQTSGVMANVEFMPTMQRLLFKFVLITEENKLNLVATLRF